MISAKLKTLLWFHDRFTGVKNEGLAEQCKIKTKRRKKKRWTCLFYRYGLVISKTVTLVMQCRDFKAPSPCIRSNFNCKLWQTAVLGQSFCCIFFSSDRGWARSGHAPAAQLYVHYENSANKVDGMAWHGMQVEVKVYHMCFANPHCRHGKRQALERPVLGNLSKGREAGL